MRISFEVKINKSVEEDIKNLLLLLDEHAEDYDLKPLNMKSVFVNHIDDPEVVVLSEKVRIND